MEVSDSKTVSIIDNKMQNIQKELERITEERKAKRLKEEERQRELEIEERKEIRRQEREIAKKIAIEELIKSQEKSRLRKEELRTRGIEPNF